MPFKSIIIPNRKQGTHSNVHDGFSSEGSSRPMHQQRAHRAERFAMLLLVFGGPTSQRGGSCHVMAVIRSLHMAAASLNQKEMPRI